MPDKEFLKQFADTWKMAKGTLTKTEFETAFKAVLDFVKKLAAQNLEETYFLCYN